MSSFKMTACCFYGLLLLKVSTIKKKKKSRRLRQREEVTPSHSDAEEGLGALSQCFLKHNFTSKFGDNSCRGYGRVEGRKGRSSVLLLPGKLLSHAW